MNTRRILTIASFLFIALAVTFCKRQPLVNTVSDSNEVPELPETPVDYPASSNDYLAALGRVLFYDKELSANKNISCGSCHQQAKAFTDNLQFSPGTDHINTSRNTPSIFNKNGRLFWDGRANSMPELAFMPVTNKVEMNIQNIPDLIDRIACLDYYANLITHAFPKVSITEGKKLDSNMIKSAIAEFLKNFNFSDNKFNKSQRGELALTQSEQIGENLFFGEAKCSQCHHVDGTFNNGGGSSGYGNTNENHNIGLDPVNSDIGVGGVTKIRQDDGSFMMPVLLNIEYTAPYMHDGRFNTLEEVVEHYNSEIKDNPNLDDILRSSGPGSKPMKMNLSETEKKGLVDFLKTLSDPSILKDSKFSDPFVQRVR